MSVYSSERGISKVEYINTARDIEVFLIKRRLECRNKKVTTFIGKHLIDHSVEVLNSVTKANRVRVEKGNTKNRDIRKRFLYNALDELDVLESQLAVCQEIYKNDFLTPSLLKDVSAKLRTERKLIMGVMASDTVRFSNPNEVLDNLFGKVENCSVEIIT